ncbi:MAG: hypothetical protein ABR521_07325 [Gaiellaceae bacterium]
MKALAAALAVTAAVALAAPAGRAADECRGLMACISVPGPWVVVPASTRAAKWQLRCPRGIVAGLDARLDDRELDIDFDGLLGSPVNPGITTRDAVLFSGRYTGRERRPKTFRPFIGCVVGGGGARTPTRAAAFRPGQPTVLRVRTLRLAPGSLTRASHRCRRGERLLGVSHAAGLFTRRPPAARELALVRVTRAVRGGVILVAASRQGIPRGTNVAVQVHAVCARGPG